MRMRVLEVGDFAILLAKVVLPIDRRLVEGDDVGGGIDGAFPAG
jgi:hypothetical protein